MLPPLVLRDLDAAEVKAHRRALAEHRAAGVVALADVHAGVLGLGAALAVGAAAVSVTRVAEAKPSLRLPLRLTLPLARTVRKMGSWPGRMALKDQSLFKLKSPPV